MEYHLPFTAEEEKIRRKWLFWEIKIPLFILGTLFFLCLLSSFLIDVNSYDLAIIYSTMILLSIILYIPYHCAYKKPGTIYLLLNLIGTPITFLINIRDYTVKFKSEFDLESALHLILLIITTIYASRLYYLTYKLRKVNKDMQNKILISSEEYSNASSTFSLAHSLEELNEQFIILAKQYESGKGRRCIAKAYVERKKAFQNAV